MKRIIYKVNTFEKILPLLGTKISSFYAGVHSLLKQLRLVNLFDPIFSHISIQMDQSDPLYLEI